MYQTAHAYEKKRFLIKQINKLMEIMDVYECFKINSRYLK